MTGPIARRVPSQGRVPEVAEPLHSELSGRRHVDARGYPSGDLGEVPDWMGRGAWIVSGALAAAVVLALVIWEPERYADSRGRNADDASEAPGGALSPTVVRLASAAVATSGTVERAGALLDAETPLREGDELKLSPGACLHIEPHMRLCAPAPSLVVVRSLSLDQRVLEVEHGRILARLPRGQRASLVLRDGSLRAAASGGSFVFSTDAAQSEVWVAQGEVVVSRHGERHVVESGRGVCWDEVSGFSDFELDAPRRRQLSQMGSQGPRARADAAPVKRVRMQEPAAAARLVMTDPERAAVEEAEVAEVAGDGPSPDDANGDGPRLDEEVSADAVAPGAPPPPAPDAEEQGAELALTHAAALVEAGRFEDAATALTNLVTREQGTGLGRRASLALGDLRLRQFDDPLAALAAYRAALRDGSPSKLDARARLGVIDALARANRFSQERKAIEDFLARYPGSADVPRLEARRTFLGG